MPLLHFLSQLINLPIYVRLHLNKLVQFLLIIFGFFFLLS